MKALITGGTGFVGSHLVVGLQRAGYDIVILSRFPPLQKGHASDQIKFYAADLTRKDSLEGLPTDIDCVFHLAALRDSAGLRQCYETNVEGTRNLLQIVRKKKIHLKKFVFVSSLGASGLSNTGLAKKECDPAAPCTWYGKTKLLAEKELERFAGQIPYIILRPSKIYGPHDKRILFHFNLVKRGLALKLGRHPRYISMNYIDDFVDALIHVAQSDTGDGTYFFSDGNVYSWDELYTLMAVILKRRVRFIPVPDASIVLLKLVLTVLSRLGVRSIYLEPTTAVELRNRYWVCDPSKFFNDFSFKPNFFLRDGLRKTADWFIQEGLL